MAERETDLMLRVKAGDRAAFEEIYALYKKPLANFIHRLGGDKPAVEEILQETFLRLWSAAPRYEPSAKVSTYVFRIAHNAYINQVSRRRRLHRRGLEIAAPEDPSSDLRRADVRAAVWKALGTLAAGERECLVLAEFHGFKYSEISEILDIPVGTVKSRMNGAITRLREALAGLEDQT